MADAAPQFIAIAPVEELVLPYEKKGWRGGPLAAIRLGQHDDKWSFATQYSQMTGDFLYSGTPLGFWTDSDNRGLFGSRAEALAAAISHLRRQLSARPVELRKHLAWLDALLTPAKPVAVAPLQLDLFG